MARRRRGRVVRRGGFGLGALLGAAVAAGGSWIAYSRMAINHQVELPNALVAKRTSFLSSQGFELSYYVDQQKPEGRPLVLIHSVNAAASAIELKPIFTQYQTSRPVFALDLPGFGFSERQDRVYNPQVFETAILDLLRTVVGEPADVVALSLGCEFAARAALAEPERVHSLVMISPTGFRRKAEPMPVEKMEGQPDGNGGSFAYKALSFSLWDQALYDLIATKASIRYFLQKSFVGPVPEELVDYAYATSHQPGAKYAPLYFLSGQLFTEGVRPAVYERLEQPVLVIYDQDAFTSFETLPEVVGAHANWQSAQIQPTKGMPHFEKPEETFAAMEERWKDEG